MDASKFKMMADPLYGQLSLDDFLADLISQPEMQRLREVRLSNINSLLLPGGSNISRFEHSVGTALLGERAARVLDLEEADRYRLVCAALLHDVTITPFGHLMEEGFHVAGKSFNHETRLQQIFVNKAELGNMDRQIYRGRSAGFRAVLEKSSFRKHGITPIEVLSLMQGEGALGQLIKGSIDLDNIDNVCRMAHHIGIPFRRQLPLDIVDGFMLSDGTLGFELNRVEFLEEWIDLRARLYNALMTNPIDFSAKAMLIEAVRLAIVGTDTTPSIIDESNWSFTDLDLWNALAGFAPASNLTARLELGDYFDLLALYWLKGAAHSNCLGARENSMDLRRQLSDILSLPLSDVLVYWIKDKRKRRIDNLVFRSRTNRAVNLDKDIGEDSDKVLFGVLVGRKGIATRRLEEKCGSFLADIFGEQAVSKCDPRKHLTQAFQWKNGKVNEQRKLF